MMNIKKIFSVLVLCSIIPAYSQNPKTGADFDGIEWISVAEEQFSANQWICFRKTFQIEKTEKSAPFCLAVDSKYWLWVNGEPVVFEGGLKRGPNPDDTYYDCVDILSEKREKCHCRIGMVLGERWLLP